MASEKARNYGTSSASSFAATALVRQQDTPSKAIASLRLGAKSTRYNDAPNVDSNNTGDEPSVSSGLPPPPCGTITAGAGSGAGNGGIEEDESGLSPPVPPRPENAVR